MVGVDDIAPIEARLGRTADDGHRVRPDGFDLRWRQIGVRDLIEDPQLPYFLQWLVDPEEIPSASPRTATRIDGLLISGDPKIVEDFLGTPADHDHPLDETQVTWSDGEETGLVSVEFATANGPIVI